MQESEETITLILPYRGGTISQDNIIIRREIPMMTFGPMAIHNAEGSYAAIYTAFFDLKGNCIDDPLRK